MNKFTKNLTQNADQIKIQRAKILSEETSAWQNDLVNKYLAEKRELDLKLLNLSDVGPDNTYSLRPAGPNYKSREWVLEMHTVKIALRNNAINLEEALATQEEWFSDDKA